MFSQRDRQDEPEIGARNVVGMPLQKRAGTPIGDDVGLVHSRDPGIRELVQGSNCFGGPEFFSQSDDLRDGSAGAFVDGDVVQAFVGLAVLGLQVGAVLGHGETAIRLEVRPFATGQSIFDQLAPDKFRNDRKARQWTIAEEIVEDNRAAAQVDRIDRVRGHDV